MGSRVDFLGWFWEVTLRACPYISWRQIWQFSTTPLLTVSWHFGQTPPPPCWQSADTLVRPPHPLLTVSWHFGQTAPSLRLRIVSKKAFRTIFFTRNTFCDIFQWDSFLCMIFAINIIFLVKIIHLMTKWPFLGLKRGINGLKQA